MIRTTKSITAVFLLCSMIAAPIFSEEVQNAATASSPVTEQEHQIQTDSTENHQYKKHYIAAIGGMLLENVVIADWNRLVIGSSWAQVSWNDAIHFYEHKQEWDTDWYWTNFVLHPYQGNLAYLSARNCNLSFYESAAFPLVSSFLWEYFCETNAPSINDMTYTPIGGVAVGEMLYRLSLETYAKNKYMAWLVNPMRLYTVPVTGEHPHGPTGQIQELSLSCLMGTGFGRSSPLDDISNYESYAYPVYALPRIDIVYGNPYGLETNTPFSHFDLSIFGGGGLATRTKPDDRDGYCYDVSILSDGILFSRAPFCTDTKLTTVGMVFDYDFIWNPFFEISTLAPGFVIKQQIEHEKSISQWQFHLDAVLLGTSDFYNFAYQIAVPDTLYRDYSYNFGFESVASYKQKFSNGLTFDTGAYLFALYDFENQKQELADTGWELACIANAGAEYSFTPVVSLGLKGLVYIKASLYDNVTDMLQQLYTANMFVRFSLK